jgi:hypothetical protein
MSDHAAQCLAAANALEAVADDHRPEVVVGFDGFIDYIIDVVDKRSSQTEYDDVRTIADFGARISAAAGQSANIELVVTQTKIGGNGPIMANAMLGYAADLAYLGVVGEGDVVHSVFQPLADGAREVIGLGGPASTDALEFSDGKLMLGKLTPMDMVTYDNLRASVGDVKLRRLLAEAAAVATVNWTMSMGMTEIWQGLAKDILPGLRQDRPFWFVDLADPAKRTADDLLGALDAIKALQQHCDVVLGLNGSECRQLLTLLDEEWTGDKESTDQAERGAAFLGERLGLSWVMVHLVASAACAWDGGSAQAAGFLCPDPVITTGAGDHFNAGFLSALVAGLEPVDCLLVGGATSGAYVRSAISPERAKTVEFLREYAAGVQSAG